LLTTLVLSIQDAGDKTRHRLPSFSPGVCQGRGDSPEAGMSGASEVARVKPGARIGVSVSLTLTEKNRPSEIEETGPGRAKVAREQTSVAQSITPLYLFLFLFAFWPYLSNFFSIFTCATLC